METKSKKKNGKKDMNRKPTHTQKKTWFLKGKISNSFPYQNGKNCKIMRLQGNRCSHTLLAGM